MTEKRIQYWRKTITNCEEWMKPKRKVWKRLEDELNLEFQIEGLKKTQTVNISRFRPLLRQVIAATAFNYPHVFLKAEKEIYEQASLVLERAANKSIKLMSPREHVHQAIFSTMGTSVGWLKFGYNPPGNDTVAPYLSNDDMSEDFPYVQWVPSENILIDPQTPPHKMSHAKYIIEKMWVPFDMLKEEEVFDIEAGKMKKRYQIPRDFKPGEKTTDDEVLRDIDKEKTEDDEQQFIEESKQLDQMVLIYEIHDRVNKKLITFLAGVEKPIEEVPHPFRAIEAEFVLDPRNGEKLVSKIKDGTGYIVEDGFPYYALRFDVGDGFYNLPPLAYVEDLQNLIVESVSRRRDLLKRFKKMLLVANAERELNENIGTDLEKSEEGEMVFVQSPSENFFAPNFGAVPQDQLLLEKDALQYESQSVGVSDFGFAPSNRTATEMSLKASSSQLNREWMLSKIAECYETIIKNALAIMADPRYTPDDFLVNFSPEGSPVLEKALDSEHFLLDFELDVRADSLQPLIEEIDKSQTLEMANFLRGSPNIDQVELDKRIIKAFREPNEAKLMSQTANADTIKAAQLENTLMMQGQLPQVTLGEDTQTHKSIHAQMENDQTFKGLLPAQQQQIIPLRDQHIQLHDQAEAQAVQAGVPNKPRSPEIERGGAESITSVVQSNAQRTEEAARSQAQQVAERN